MPGSASDTYENNILDAILGQGFTKDATVYVALCTSAPADNAVGTEPSGNGYARVAVTNNATNWPNAPGGSKSNGVAITFPTATGSWGTVTHWMLMNHATNAAASNMIAWGSLTTSRSPVSGDTPQFAIGALVVTCD
jgi:hypothetical protein